MSAAKEQRKLAAIMFTDMVGYSALSQRDEKLAQELLEEHRGLLREIFPQFNGVEIKTIGDAFLVEFQSALEAAQCAMAIQRALAKRNADAPAERQIQIRIGIHIGDVMHRDGDVYGDGVNIASRIEPLAGAGGICVSMDVERQIRNALEARLEKLAPTELKNISVAMDVFRIVLPWERPSPAARAAKIGRTPPASGKWIAFAGLILLAAGVVWWVAHESSRQTANSPDAALSQHASSVAPPAGPKSIAVLPLVNTSGDPNNEYFSDGLSEELIAVLARIPDLKVIGRSSSFLFKGKSVDSAAIGEKLGVAHLIEGSVRKQGDRVRIVAELINAADGRSLWSETYDRELKDVFAVQAEIARSVAQQMKVKLLGETVPSAAAETSKNAAAHNAVLQADFYFRQESAESVRRAIAFLQEAIRLDPNYALAYAKLAQAWRRYAASFSTDGADDTANAYAEARRAAERALSLAPDLTETRMALGLQAINPDLNFPAAEKEFRRVAETAPSDAVAKNGLSQALSAQGRLSEAEQVAREVISLDPLLTTSWYNIGRVMVGLGRYQEAEQFFRKGLEIQPQAARFHSYLAILDILQNRPAEARANAQREAEGFWRDYALNLVQQALGDRTAGDAMLKDFIERYSKNGAFQIAVLYAIRKEPDEMFRWLDAAYASRDSGLTQLAVTPFLLPYVSDPRFMALCQKLNVQLPSAPTVPAQDPAKPPG